jgi:hypothetical protein
MPRPDEVLPRLAEFLGGMLALDRAASDAVLVDRLEFDLPVELDLQMAPAGGLTLGASPPTQWIATTVMPVFHRMRLRIEAQGD